MKLKSFITILSLMFASPILRGQQKYILTPLSTQEQLPVASIHTLIQDKEGFMWYATRDGGLCRDNGYQIDVFRSDRFNPTLIGKSNHINDIQESFDGNIIFTNKDGLYILDKKDYSIRSIDKEMTGQIVEPILMASDSTLWTSANGIVYHYDKNLNRIGSYSSMWNGRTKFSSRMMEDTNGNIWISQWNGGIIRYDKKTNHFVEEYWEDNLIPINIVEDEANNCLWIATWGNGIVKYVPGKKIIEFQISTIPDREFDSQIIYMVKDRKLDRLYASTMYGLKAYDIVDGNLKSVDFGDILPSGMGITDYMTIDNRGNIWVAGFPPHIFILSPSNEDITRNDFANVKHRLNNRPIIWNSVREDEYIWLGQERLLLCLYDTRTGDISFAKNAGIKNYSEMNLAKFRKCKTQKGIWSYTDNAVYHIWNQDMDIKADLLATVSGKIQCVYDDGLGNIYVGHSRGIDIVRLADNQISHLPIKSTKITDIGKASDGILYYCSEDGQFACLDKDGRERIISDIGDFITLAIDKGGIVWASDLQGDLLRYNPTTQTAIIDENGSNIKGDYIRSIAIDPMGYLWLLSDQEIKIYNSQNGKYRILSNSDSEIRMDYFYNVSTDENNIWVNGAGAILGIKPQPNLEIASSSAYPVVTSISVDGKNRIIGKGIDNIDIEEDAVNIEIQFSTLNHLNSQKVFYAYKVKEIDNQWHYLSRGINKASFVKLPKGKYTIQLMATDEYSAWGEPVNALMLHRLPAWYETWYAYVIYVVLAIGLILLAIKYYIVSQQKKQHEDMAEKLTEMKFRFFTNISHELRTPLTLILTPLQSIRRRISDWNRENPESSQLNVIDTQLSLIDNNAQRLLLLVNRLLDFRKLETGQQKLQLQKGDFYEFVRNACEAFRPMSREKSVGLGCAIPNKSLFINFDKEKMHHIIVNLLSNAFKFTPEGGNIAITVSEQTNGTVSITVKDTGCGISEQDLPHIFERFFQGRSISGETTGTGIGLNMVHEMVKLHGGTITVDSREGESTTFIVSLPTNLNTESTPDYEVPKKVAEEEVSAALMSANILIVDDNDEFRQFLSRELSEKYNILQASDGEEALKVMADHDIDLVLSDVMMPNIDGMELCRRVKEDVNTSHIMVILLTARTAEEIKIEGFRCGADDYLSKPFNLEMLELRISHLLELRRKRNEDFQKGEEIKVEEVALNNIDRKFLNDAMAAVEKNMENEEYDIDSFATDVYMSRSTLYRKVVSLTGQKPSEFIRTIRLKYAAQLIKEGKYPITRISSMCGFSSASYFYRSFKKQYGVAPGNYR